LSPIPVRTFSNDSRGTCRSKNRIKTDNINLDQAPDSAFVFATERGGPFTPDAVNRLVKRIGVRARLPFPVHAHMVRHACGYALANARRDTRRIQDWLRHRSIQHTTRYTQLSAAPFKDFWR
jgi:type 1 fimbriae regulatory protein FimB/type 1 fimbriae regulatory protein FimE